MFGIKIHFDPINVCNFVIKGKWDLIGWIMMLFIIVCRHLESYFAEAPAIAFGTVPILFLWSCLGILSRIYVVIDEAARRELRMVWFNILKKSAYYFLVILLWAIIWQIYIHSSLQIIMYGVSFWVFFIVAYTLKTHEQYCPKHSKYDMKYSVEMNVLRESKLRELRKAQ